MAKHKAVSELLAGHRLDEDESFSGIHRCYGSDASAETYFFNYKEAYDFIVSCAVVEHLADPEAALAGMIGALKPGGAMAHVIDLRDHGMFSYKWHELKFLEVPEFLYRRMVAASGRPNRYLLPDYRDMMDGMRVETDFRVTSLAGAGRIDPSARYDSISEATRRKSTEFVRAVRGGFDPRFSAYSDEELSVTGFVLLVRKSPNV